MGAQITHCVNSDMAYLIPDSESDIRHIWHSCYRISLFAVVICALKLKKIFGPCRVATAHIVHYLSRWRNVLWVSDRDSHVYRNRAGGSERISSTSEQQSGRKSLVCASPYSTAWDIRILRYSQFQQPAQRFFSRWIDAFRRQHHLTPPSAASAVA